LLTKIAGNGWKARKSTLIFSTLAASVVLMALQSAASQEPAVPMAPNAVPSFEVATIKLTDPSDTSRGFHISGRSIYIENEDLEALISVAYSIHKVQIVDAPAWFAKNRYDIKGTPDVAGVPDLHQYQLMIQHLLADRFQLKFNREKRELSVYAIKVAKGGPKIAKSSRDPQSLPDQTGNGGGAMRFTNVSMADFTLGMQEFLEKPVVDQTGLSGRFDFELHWTPDNAPASDDPNAPPDIFTAVQEELGLKIDSTKALVNVLAIVHAEHPSEN
jgi:uncharacterized protein (TIGR03435 family)